MGWQVALSDDAIADLESVVAFLAQKSPGAAERIGLELVERIFSLGELPHRGAWVRKRPSLRKLAHRHYLVIYRVRRRWWRLFAYGTTAEIRIGCGCRSRLNDARTLFLGRARNSLAKSASISG